MNDAYEPIHFITHPIDAHSAVHNHKPDLPCINVTLIHGYPSHLSRVIPIVGAVECICSKSDHAYYSISFFNPCISLIWLIGCWCPQPYARAHGNTW